MKNRLVYHVAPDKDLEEWLVIRDGAKQPRKKGLTKEKAIRTARRLLEKKAKPALLLIHKTRYIIERQLQLSR
ncbi:MAG TPA: DUF2188 domain-containing protein [Candidatus Kapabacteria bacterium]|nr:DUF2188 domain-containing protein [Candidatus Kapabacteria bacterium]